MWIEIEHVLIIYILVYTTAMYHMGAALYKIIQ